nr:hypothetical protein [Tanacetum cinerariifolium]
MEYLEKSPNVVTTVLPTKEPEYSLSMGYKHLNTTLKMESAKIIKSGVEEFVPILSENDVTSEDKRECDVLVFENSPIFDDHSEILSDSNDDDILSNDDAFEDIEYVEASLPDSEFVSLEEENDVYHEKEEVDLEDIFQIQDVILREKLLRINCLIANIESLNDNPTLDCVLNSFASIPIFEESDNSFLDNSSPEFDTFSDHTKETRSGSTNAHDFLLEYDSFCFNLEPDSKEMISAMMNTIDEHNKDDPGEEFDISANAEDDDYFPFMFVIRIFLPYIIYHKVFPLLLSAESEDTIFDLGISV